ncbi:MAG: hypothetical protein KKD90_01680 [Candidatus Omnitrophica bacterium]|nr:hypothetical protein [Candidatus Omnitrophota bacterium]
MMRIRKGYNIRLISLTVAFCFILNSNIYATGSPVNSHLRVPMQIEKKRIFEAQRIFLRDKLKRIPADVAITVGLSTIFLIYATIGTLERHNSSEHRLNAIEYVIDKLTNFKCQLISPHADVSNIEPGDINLLLSAHGSSGDFIELIPVLDKIFEKAKNDNKKIILYTENSPPTTKEGISVVFPDLDIEKVFEDIRYEREFWERIKESHKIYLTYYERILKEDVEILPGEDFKLDSQMGFLLFMQRYMQGKSFDGYDLSVIPEQASLNTPFF